MSLKPQYIKGTEIEIYTDASYPMCELILFKLIIVINNILVINN